MSDEMTQGAQPYAASIVVPAHNEAQRIGPLLQVLSDVSRQFNVLVLVVCNGCSDDTVEVARRVPGLVVMELPESSKCAALNAGDAAAQGVFPRLYVDADAQTDGASLLRLVESLRVDRPLAIRPESQPVVSSSSWWVRRCVEGKDLIPSSRQWSELHLEGNAIYGTNAVGRRRFDDFPDIVADDAFFDRMFDPDEKLVVHDALVRIPSPVDLASYRAMLRRVFAGNEELAQWLRRHRPDRLTSATSSAAESPRPRRSLSYFLHGGNTVPSWRPRVVMVVAMTLVTRFWAKWESRWHRSRGRVVPWR